MDGYLSKGEAAPIQRSRQREAAFFIAGVIGLLVIGFTLEDELGMQFDTTYRIACAALCICFIYKIGVDHRRERWLWVSLWLALLVNIGIFFTPLIDRPASRGEVMIFALPDAVIVLAARIASYRPGDVHERARRQTMILGLVVAVVFCVGFLGLTWMQARGR